MTSLHFRQRHNQCVAKTALTRTDLAPPELAQPEFLDIGSDTVLLYTGTDL
jgi:hypothetical protein